MDSKIDRQKAKYLDRQQYKEAHVQILKTTSNTHKMAEIVRNFINPTVSTSQRYKRSVIYEQEVYHVLLFKFIYPFPLIQSTESQFIIHLFLLYSPLNPSLSYIYSSYTVHSILVYHTFIPLIQSTQSQFIIYLFLFLFNVFALVRL